MWRQRSESKRLAASREGGACCATAGRTASARTMHAAAARGAMRMESSGLSGGGHRKLARDRGDRVGMILAGTPPIRVQRLGYPALREGLVDVRVVPWRSGAGAGTRLAVAPVRRLLGRLPGPRARAGRPDLGADTQPGGHSPDREPGA